MRVPLFSMINMVITVVAIFGLPLIFFYVFRKKTGLFRAMAAGAMAFFVAQYVVRIPLMNQLLMMKQFSFVFENPLLYAVILAFSAAFFELLFRILILKYFVSGTQKKHHILAVGFGHGMIEAILLVGLSYINNLIISSLINTDRVSELISDSTSAEVINKVVDTLVNTNSWIFLIGGVERILIITVHMALTILAYKGLKDNAHRIKYWGGAFLIHFLLDFSVVFFQLAEFPILFIELVIVGFAIGAWFIIKKFYHEPEMIIKKEQTLLQDVNNTK